MRYRHVCSFVLLLEPFPHVSDTHTVRGQALNNAMQDAALLVEHLKSVSRNEKTLKEAIDSYEAEMIPRGAKEVELSLEQGLLCHDWETFRESPYFKGVGMFKPDAKTLVAQA